MMKNLTKKVTKVFGLIALTLLSESISAQTTNWSLAGPVYGAGRARNIIVDKNDATGKTLYISGTTSGIFKTVNGGAKWFPINDSSNVHNISYLAQAQDGTIYAATGEGFLRGVQRTQAEPGTGLYKLVNNSLILVSGSSVVGTVINRLACSPVNNNVIALATNKGIMISIDGGGSFNPAPGITITNSLLTSGQDVKFDSQGVLYCSIGSERGDAVPTYSAVSSKVWKSSDASLSSFSDITPVNSALADANYGRIELAIAPSNNNVIYASCAKKYFRGNSNFSGGLQGLFVSYDAGATWGLILQGSSNLDPLSAIATVQGFSFYSDIASGDYAQVITVNPTNPNQLFVGSYLASLFTKTGGSNSSPIGSWNTISIPFVQTIPGYMHENIHDIKIIGSGSTAKFYFVTDAGVYRSIDLGSAITDPNNFPSYQPFYKGLTTGQFNSVSIQRYPLSITDTITHPGYSVISPFSGFIGGTSGNGLNYYSGKDTLVSQEISYGSGDVVYNAEFSKILPDAAYFAKSTGVLWRTASVKTTEPSTVLVNAYSGPTTNYTIVPNPFQNDGYPTSGVPFKLWEYYGQTPNNPDIAVFYNDTVRAATSVSSVDSLIKRKTFTIDVTRPNHFALIDSIVIRTGTITLNLATNVTFANCPSAFTGADKKDVSIKLINPVNTGTTTPSTSITGNVPVSAASVTLNAVNYTDRISITYSLPPFATKTIQSYPVNMTGTNIIIPDASVYYRVFATIFYKYKVGDSVSVTDNNITTQPAVYTTTLSQPLSWAYGSNPNTYTLSANQYSNVTNPTYSINPGGTTQSSPVFTVGAAGVYTISQYGNYTLSATPIIYSITAETPAGATTHPGYTLMPSGITQTLATFTLDASNATSYTITSVDDQSSPTATIETFVDIDAPAYDVNSSGTPQASPLFILTATASSIYTLQSEGSYTISSSVNPIPTVTPISSSMTVSTDILTPPTIKTITSNSVVAFSKNNPPVKIPINGPTARIATSYNQNDITNNAYAVVVAKNPLDLSNPLNFVRVSANGCLTTKPDGSPDSVNKITISGKPTVIEWSKSGSELYYATDANKLYRVSYINLIMDLSTSCYSGKLSTDVFVYKNSGGFDVNTPNLNSPYRTTLIGSFSKPITSISVSNDNQNLVLTFNDPTGTIVMTNTADARTSNTTNIGWTPKTGTLTNIATYCSLIEKGDKNTVYIGTDNGLFYTKDFSSNTPTWHNAKDDASPLPNVQVFDIKQQVMESYQCYNSGIIYVATNGRGIWMNKAGYKEYVTGVQEFEHVKKENNLSIFPNPTNGHVTVAFNSNDDEQVVLNVMDINGRVVKSENLGKINPGEVTYSFDTASLPSGVYIVSVNSNAKVKRVTKLIVTK